MPEGSVLLVPVLTLLGPVLTLLGPVTGTSMALPIGQLVLFSTAIIIFLVVRFGASGQEEKVEFERIVNGKEVEEGERSYQASVQLNFGTRLESTKPTHFCGGAFIAENWVLTAAHCVRNQNSRKLKIVGGTNDITDKSLPGQQDHHAQVQ